jgi:hypothetical protein
MNCRQFERICNELIDAGLPIMPQSAAGAESTSARTSGASLTAPYRRDLERRLLGHAASCPACRQLAARYETLRRALCDWVPPPAPPGGLAERILAAARAAAHDWPERRAAIHRPRRVWRVRLPMAAAAAAVLAAGVLGLLFTKLTGNQPPGNDSKPAASLGTRDEATDRAHPTARDAVALHDAVAGATEATWDLARSASEPAARISRHVLDAAAGPEQEPSPPASGADPASLPSLSSLARDSATAVAVLQQFGDNLATGVRPLSTTARHAFGFLLAPAAAKPDDRASPPAGKGT